MQSYAKSVKKIKIEDVTQFKNILQSEFRN